MLCTKKDYYKQFTKCKENMKRDLEYRWLQPHFCETKDGVDLPPKETDLECSKCPEGTFRVKDRCKSCLGVGEYFDKEKKECKKCGEGSYSKLIKTYDFNEYENLPPNFQTKCLGICHEHKGFRLITDHETNNHYLDSGYIFNIN
jgi:hypothetical protein